VGVILAAAQAVGERKDTALVPALRDRKKNPPAGVGDWFGNVLDETIKQAENASGVNGSPAPAATQ